MESVSEIIKFPFLSTEETENEVKLLSKDSANPAKIADAKSGLWHKLWHDGARDWAGSWSEGDVIGLAANVDIGKVAVAKNGCWSGEGLGVVFEDAKIMSGVYPALSVTKGELRYCFSAPFSFGPPEPNVWQPEAASLVAARAEQ